MAGTDSVLIISWHVDAKVLHVISLVLVANFCRDPLRSVICNNALDLDL
jgi:hypothetical protein